MTKIERIEELVKTANLEEDTWQTLVALAYYIGQERATKRVSDKYNALLAGQIERANKERYKNVAMRVQGNVKNIYDGDYAQGISNEFGNDSTNL